jgi:hypothetical protein
LDAIAALSRCTALPLEPTSICHESALTLVDLLAVHDQAIDVAPDFNEGLVLVCLLLFASFHQPSDVLREELRLLGVDDVEQELPVDRLDLTDPCVDQVWQVLSQFPVFKCVSKKTSD